MAPFIRVRERRSFHASEPATVSNVFAIALWNYVAAFMTPC